MSAAEKANPSFNERDIFADERLSRVFEGREFLLFDGAMGTMLQAAGLELGHQPELLCIENPSLVQSVHEQYVQAGADVITTNTFGANAFKLSGEASVDVVFAQAINCAKRSGAAYVAADIGPIGTLLQPLGTLSFDEAYALFKEQVIAAAKHGADIILIETMTDLLEMKAAILAAKEHSNLPIFATMTFEQDGRTFLGTSPEIAAVTLSALGVQALGINCSLSPRELKPMVARMLGYARCPLMVQANAGLPEAQSEGVARYSISAEEYAREVSDMLDEGVSITGGCCGTTPAYIKALAQLMQEKTPATRKHLPGLTVCSAQNLVSLDLTSAHIAVIGERINPTGKPRLKEVLRSQHYDYLIEEALKQHEAGADLLDVNVGLPELDEEEVLVTAVKQLQAITNLPLQIDSSDVRAIESAVRIYAGKPLINSVNGKRESLDTILPLAKKYGCAVVGLTLDETGIPPSAEERFRIAEKIVSAARDHGIPTEDIVIDCLVMAAATNQAEIAEILKAIPLVKQKLGVKTVLGVSNVSFGLPARELVNATFLASAFGAGLDMPILNPLSNRYRDVVNSYKVLNGQDVGAQHFIEHYAQWQDGATSPDGARQSTSSGHTPAAHLAPDLGSPITTLETPDLIDHTIALIESGRKAQMAEATTKLLESLGALEIINQVFIPALNIVGDRFEQGKLFLPQLMVSAEAVKAGFAILKEHVRAHSASGTQAAETLPSKGKICLATVKGDIHDIGKNIVKMLLENYGYEIHDLGKDVEPERILEAVRRYDIPLVGLSALMTTTVRSMEETIELLHKEAPQCKIFVGGAVLSPEYAQMIGADYYGKDAAAAAHIAEEFFAVHPSL